MNLADKGILEKFYVNNDKMWFDSNLQDHYHFYDSDKDELLILIKTRYLSLSLPRFLLEKLKTLLIL